jgi:ketosteroid isomerase-like protein
LAEECLFSNIIKKGGLFMKRIVIVIGVAVLVFAVAVQAQTQAQPNEEVGQQSNLKRKMSNDQELIKLENEWGEALVKHDWAFLDQILADDYIWTDPDGNSWTKTELLASLKSGEDVITSAVTEGIRVRIYGDAAVVRGRTTVKEQCKGKDISGEYRWTDMWVKDYAGRWRCVADHSSRIVAQK